MKWINHKKPPAYVEVLLYHPFEKIDGTPSFIKVVGYYDKLNQRYIVSWSSMLPCLPIDMDQYFELKLHQVTNWSHLPRKPRD